MKTLQKLRQKLNEYERGDATVDNLRQRCLHNLLIKRIEGEVKQFTNNLAMALILEETRECKTIDEFYTIMERCTKEAEQITEAALNNGYESTLHRGGRTIFSGDLGGESIN